MAVSEDEQDAARGVFARWVRDRNMREFTVTIVVDPQQQDDPDLRYVLARAKHHGERIGIVVGGFNYDVGLQLVQLGSVEVEVPGGDCTAPGCTLRGGHPGQHHPWHPEQP